MPSKTLSPKLQMSAKAQYPSYFQDFATSVLSTAGTYDNIHHWSNSQAKYFFRLMANCPYTQAEVASDLRTSYYAFEKTKAELRATARASHASHASVDADPKMAKAAGIYPFLYKEFDLWFSAFEAEAEEEGTSAEDCWTYQTAKKFSKRTGLSMPYLTAVISKWLDEKF